MTRVLCLLTIAVVVYASGAFATDTWRVEVRETAGIRRFKYPVCVELQAGVAADAFELLADGQPIEAQFTKLADARENDAALWSVDFQVDLAPLETREFTLTRGRDAAPTEKRPRGLSVERADGTVHVRHPTLDFVVAENLGGLFRKITVGGDEWTVAGGKGLLFTLRDGTQTRLGQLSAGQASPEVRVIKSGPLAAIIEFAGKEQLQGGVVQWLVRFDFPLGKSWVRVDCTLADPADLIAALAASVRLRLEPEDRQPILADVGADGWTYATLASGESLQYRAGPVGATDKSHDAWSVNRVSDNVSKPFALPSNTSDGLPAQGWAHLMDRRRCTAIAIDRFGRDSSDGIDLSADGLVELSRAFPSPTKAGDGPQVSSAEGKRLAFWLHVVRSPPQIGAATSPQSMLAPPKLRAVRQADGDPSAE